MEATQKQLKIDGEFKFFDSEKTFGAITEEVRVTLPSNRVLTEIIVDSKAIDLVEEEVLNQKSFKALGEVVLKTRAVDELFRESLVSAHKICEALQMDCDEMNQFLESEKFTDAGDRLAEMSSLLEWLIQLVVGAQSLGEKRVEDMVFSHGSVMDACTRMQARLADLHGHLAAGKWTEFRTVLTGEFKGELKVWESMFSELATSWVPRTSTRES